MGDVQAETALDTVLLGTIDPALPAGPQVFAHLQDAILNMSFTPGQALSEPDVGAVLGVSRTPVREAFARLRAIDLVTTFPSRGSYVTKLNEAKIREAQYLREALELANIERLATGGLSAEMHQRLDDLMEQQAVAVAAGDIPTFRELDNAFHIALAEATTFPRAAIILGQEKAHLDRLRMLELYNKDHIGTLASEHRALLDAIAARDPLAARAIAIPHLRSILTVLRDLAVRNAEYFDTA